MVVVQDDDDTVESAQEEGSSEHRLRNQIATFSEQRDFGGSPTYWWSKDCSSSHQFWILFGVSFCMMVVFIAIFFIIFSFEGRSD
jgi:hypothetical protein